MKLRSTRSALAETWCGAAAGIDRRARQAIVVVVAVMLLTAAAHIRVPMWPVPTTMQTFAVLLVGAACGPALAAGSLVAYLGLGALGLSIFTGNGAAQGGFAYLAGPTGGYLLGFVFAASLVGWLFRRGWGRSIPRMAAALLAGNATIYVFGLAWMSWLFAAEKGIGWVLQWGMVQFLPGDIVKLALAFAIVRLLHADRSRLSD